MIKVLIVDDHEMVRLGISSYLGIQHDIEVIGEAENGADGRDQALADRPDAQNGRGDGHQRNFGILAASSCHHFD